MVLPMGKPEAVACVSGEGKLCGCVKFYAAGCGCLVAAEIRGLPESDTGFFAFHIHEGGDCGGTDFSDTGGHFNPENQAHPRHAGDLPPLLSDHGTATLLVQTSRFTPGEVIGRTVVIHQNPDDFHTQSAGNAGRKIACGMIRRA
ncbi:MAG: superoxide dismutase family protein [Faecousia sp.]